MSGFLVRLGVGGRLLLAFLGITAFAGLGAAAGFYALLEIGDVLERITQQRVPSAFAAQEVSRQAERVVSAAPMLLTVTDERQRAERSRRVDAELERLEELIRNLARTDFSSSDLNPIWDISRKFRLSLLALNIALNSRLVLASRKKEAVQQLLRTHDQTQQLLEPWVLVTNARIAKWRDAKSRAGSSPDEREAADSDLDESLSWLSSLQQERLLLTSFTEKLQGLAVSGNANSLKLTDFRLTLLLREAKERVAGLAPKLQPQMSNLLDRFAGFASGPDSITRIRQAELANIAEAERLLRQNAGLSRRLTEAVDKLVARARNDMATANREALSARRFSLSVTAVAVALSLLSSALIVWLYVGRNLVARLTALSNSMLAIAGGNLKAELPTSGGDEIGRMAEALTIFRDTAVEIEDKNLREIAGARQRLVDAIESISQGFALYNSDDRLVLCNSRYYEIMYPDNPNLIEPGMSFETIIRNAAELGLIRDAEGRVDEWVAERMARHRDPRGPAVHRRASGQWIQSIERQTDDGGTVAVYSDISDLKQVEEALQERTEFVQLLQSITRAANEAASVEDVIQIALDEVCAHTGWPVGHAFVRDGDATGQVVSSGLWHLEDSEFLAEFRNVTGSTTIASGVGLVGRVLAERTPTWGADLTPDRTFPRADVAARAGLKGAFAFPVMAGREVVAVLEFFSKQTAEPYKPLFDVMEQIGIQLGRVVERAHAESELREAKEQAENALSDLKEAQANLIHAEKMASLGQMTAGIAHEIKNPLNFVNNFAQTSVELISELQVVVEPGLGALAEDGRDDAADLFATLRSDLDTIANHGRRADGIVKNMLLHSRGGADDHEPTNVNALVEESVKLAYHGERARDSEFNIGIEYDFDPEAGVVDLLPQEITRVLVNLSSNGFYATHKRMERSEKGYEPMIRVSTRSHGDGVEIRVRDNGTGMPAKVREKLFTPFFTTKPAGEGTGLGLSLSFDIITQQHQGSIEAASKEGEFTEFTIRLPRRFGGASPVGNEVSP